MALWTLGIGGSDHDFSAALMRGQDIRVAIEEERLSRRKHAPAFWYEDPIKNSIEYCLQAEQISLADVSAIVGSDTLPARVRRDLQPLSLHLFPHHLCHAASAYMMLPAGTKAGIIVYDGYGSIRGPASNDPFRNQRETFSFYRFSPDGCECLGNSVGLAYMEGDDFQIGVTNSMGMLYELVTALLGYDAMESGKTMGLSSYGLPRFVDVIEEFVEYRNDASDCFRCGTDNSNIVTAIKSILSIDNGSFSVRADLAASIQAIMNKALLNCSQFFSGIDIDCLCISGGCALNSVANSFFAVKSPLSLPIVVPPHCGDAGLAFGALWLQQRRQAGTEPEITFRERPTAPYLARPGRNYTPHERREAAYKFYPNLNFDAAVSCAVGLARELSKGQIVGLFRGGSEFGPRALGGRSILADPRSIVTRERINRIIKERESFRPLAPIVLRSDYEEYFLDDRCVDCYMLKIAKVRETCIKEAPAIVHIDGTARVQVVCEETDPFLAEILKNFRKATGVGLLINTSFNRRGEPIVETPIDALDAFLKMGLDGLYLDGEYYRNSVVDAQPSTTVLY
jgi:carbamoyltransferase